MRIMYVCNECQSTQFEKSGGLLYCAVCQIQQPDYVDQTVEYSTMISSRPLNKKKGKQEDPQATVLTKNWTLWEAYNYILIGFIQDLTATGFAPVKLSSKTISVWSCFLHSSGVGYKTLNAKISTAKGQRAKMKMKTEKKIQKKPAKSNGHNGVLKESLHLHASSGAMAKLIYKKHKQFLNSQSTQACDLYADETIETIGKSFHKDGFGMGVPISQQSKISSCPDNLNVDNGGKKPSTKRKCIPMSKGRLLEMLHLALLFDHSPVQLSDLLRFIREAHLSFAKITHFLPREMKVIKGDNTLLETLHCDAMPKHGQQRVLGAEVARKLKVEEFPFPNMKSLICRYCKDLNLPDGFVNRAYVISKLSSVKNFCSFQHLKREIPNYEGTAAACLVYAMKVLFGLDDQTEFLLSDIAEKSNRFLNLEKDDLLFSFREWQNFIELRKTVIKEVHYPTEEKLARSEYLSSSGLIDIISKESKDVYKDERFMAYSQYFMNPGLTKVCQDVLTALAEPKTNFKMDFPPSLTPFTSYTDSILNRYEERIKNKTPEDAYLPELHPNALKILRSNYADRDMYFVFNLEKYKELLGNNGFTVKKIFKREKCETEEDKEKLEGTTDEKSIFSSSDPIEKLKDTRPKCDKSSRSKWSKINYLNLPSSKKVYFVEDMTETWELISPHLTDGLEISFLTDVFAKTPVNFQWFVKELSLMLEMTEREIYMPLYKIEKAIKKAMTLSDSAFEIYLSSV